MKPKLSYVAIAATAIFLSMLSGAIADAPDISNLLQVSKDQFEGIRKVSSATQESIDKAVTNIGDWFKEQPQFPKIQLDRKWIEHLYLVNKADTEATKSRIDAGFSLRKTNPLSRYENVQKNIVEGAKSAKAVVLPKLTKDFSRPILIKVKDTPLSQVNYTEYLLSVTAFLQLRIYRDYSLRDLYIYDLANMSDERLDKFRDEDIANIGSFIAKGIGSQFLDRVLFLNGKPGIADKFIEKCRLNLVPELFEKFYKIDSFDDLDAIMPRELLPSDYGGLQKNSDDIYDEWISLFSSPEIIEWFKEQDSYFTDELKRPREPQPGDQKDRSNTIPEIIKWLKE